MERIQIQTFIAHRPVEPLVVAVLPRAARITLQRRGLVLGQPASHGQGHAFWPIMAARELRRALQAKQLIPYPHDLGRRPGARHLNRQPCTRELVHHGQHLQWRTRPTGIMDEIVGALSDLPG